MDQPCVLTTHLRNQGNDKTQAVSFARLRRINGRGDISAIRRQRTNTELISSGSLLAHFRRIPSSDEGGTQTIVTEGSHLVRKLDTMRGKHSMVLIICVQITHRTQRWRTALCMRSRSSSEVLHRIDAHATHHHHPPLTGFRSGSSPLRWDTGKEEMGSAG